MNKSLQLARRAGVVAVSIAVIGVGGCASKPQRQPDADGTIRVGSSTAKTQGSTQQIVREYGSLVKQEQLRDRAVCGVPQVDRVAEGDTEMTQSIA